MYLSDHHTESFSDNNFGQRKTYLSRNVKKLVYYQPEELVCQTDDKLFLEDGILDWMKIEKKCNLQECFSSTDGYNYQLAVSRLHPISSFIHNYVTQYTCEEFEQQYMVQLEWLAKRDVLLHCFHLMKTSRPGSIEASLLLITSTLERILGDIFMSYSNATHCPLLLQDLLGMSELKSVLGETVIHCLELYIGSPTGLNLRNLAWHGFLSQGEVAAHYASFLLMMAVSLGDLVKTKNKSLTTLKERPLIKYSESKLLREIFPEIQIQTDNLADMFRKSNFVTSSMVEIWYLLLHFYEKERFADAVMMMLPQLENSLRRVYAYCNDLPERVQTAESSEFYTTFNEILSPLLTDGACNNLPKTIGYCYTEMLLDILVQPDGPRLRDHIGHGEVDMFDFPKDFANHLLCISIALSLKFSSDKELAVEPFLEISKVADSYSSIYHPCSCLRRECLSYIEDLLEWEKLPKPNDQEFMCDNSQNSSDIISFKTTIDVVFRNYDHLFPRITRGSTEKHHCDETVLRVLRILKKTKLSTLFRPRHELELVSILRQIVRHCFQTSKQIQQTAKSRYEEWKKKELRSRQRNNYSRFWSHNPFIKQVMCLFVVVVVLELVNIENVERHNETQVKFLKRSLQCAENLVNLSSSSRNRWQECADIGTLWMHKTCDYYSETSNKNT